MSDSELHEEIVKLKDEICDLKMAVLRKEVAFTQLSKHIQESKATDNFTISLETLKTIYGIAGESWMKQADQS